MVDLYSPAKRSEIMSRVRGKGNKATELALVSVLRRNRITGWRRNARLFGSPDFVFPKDHIALFVDGCFWHSCPIHASQPRTNAEFWSEKLSKNRLRDGMVNRTLKKSGWRVIRIWQHELSVSNEDRLVGRLLRAFDGSQPANRTCCSSTGL
jgi:DNA mismatch endonuclease (patch repair protein)